MPDRVVCDRCHGLGWHPASGGTSPGNADGQEWPVHCELCGGAGSLSLHAVAKMIGEHHDVLHRLYQQRVRPRTATRLFSKLFALSELWSAGNPGDNRDA